MFRNHAGPLGLDIVECPLRGLSAPYGRLVIVGAVVELVWAAIVPGWDIAFAGVIPVSPVRSTRGACGLLSKRAQPEMLNP